MTEQQQRKQQAIDLLETRYRGMENVCEGIYPKVSGSISDAQVQAEPENRWSSESRAKRLAA